MWGASKNQFAAIILMIGATGCSGTIHKTSKLGDIDVLSIDARQRLILSGNDRYGNRITCAEPSPDAIVARAATLAAQGNLTSGTNSTGGGIAGSSSEAAASIGLRTQTIQLMRDGYFRLCEALLNNQIDRTDYTKVVNGIDEFMIAMMAIDTLGGTARAPAIIIGTSGKAATTKDGVTAETLAGAETSVIQDIKISDKSMSADQAKAIRQIGSEFLHRRAIQRQQYLKRVRN